MVNIENTIKNLVSKYNIKYFQHPIVVFDFVSLDNEGKLMWWTYNIEEVNKDYKKFVLNFIGTGDSKKTLIKTEYDRDTFLYFELGNSALITDVNSKIFQFAKQKDPIGIDDNFNNTLPDREVIEAYEKLFKEKFENGSTIWVSLPHTDNKNRKVYSAIFALFNNKIDDKKNQLETYRTFRDFIVTYLIELYKAPIEKQKEKLEEKVEILKEKEKEREDFVARLSKDYGSYHIPSIWKNRLSEIEPVIRSKQPIIICGDTGTGKEIIAKIIHDESGESKNNFTPLNCSGYVGDDALIESELFGMEEGIATGVSDVIGLFEKYKDGGTIFFDEIQQMPLKFQMKLKRVIQEGKFTKRTKGGPEEITTKARLIFATNVRPRESFKKKELLEDFYYRISTFKIYLPSLSEMNDEIDGFIRKLLERINDKPPESFKAYFPKEFSPQALEKLKQYNYGGNIRELENVIKRACFTSKKEKKINEEYIHFDEEIIQQSESKDIEINVNGIQKSKSLYETVAIIKNILKATDGKSIYGNEMMKSEFMNGFGTNPNTAFQNLKNQLKRKKEILEKIDALNPTLNIRSLRGVDNILTSNAGKKTSTH